MPTERKRCVDATQLDMIMTMLRAGAMLDGGASGVMQECCSALVFQLVPSENNWLRYTAALDSVKL